MPAMGKAAQKLPAAGADIATVDEYTTDPARLADEIERALAKYSSADDRHLLRTITFFEGELRAIVEALRQG
jgi:hypothetical protein